MQPERRAGTLRDVRGAPDVDDEIVAAMSAICLALPETSLRTDAWAHAYEIRRKMFAILATAPDPSGRPVPLLAFHPDPEEREALLAMGHPFFPARNGQRIGMLLGPDIDWTEIRELVTDSYRQLAPKKLVALLDD